MDESGSPTNAAATTSSGGLLRTRLAVGAVGVLAIGYGAVRIFTDAKDTKPWALGRWLLGSLLVHDLIIAPLVIGIGWLLARTVPSRARRYLQGGLVTGGLIAGVGVILIRRQGKTSSPALSLLRQNYTANLLILLAIVAVVTAAAYAVEVWRDNRTNSRPPADQ